MPTIETISKTTQLPSDSISIEQVEQDIQRITNKLSNGGYLSKAPAAAVEKEQLKLASLKRDLARLQNRSNP